MAETLQTQTCDEFRPQLAAYALGDDSLDAPARAHLLNCQECRLALQEYATLANMMPLEVADQQPSPALRARIIGAVEQELALTKIKQAVALATPAAHTLKQTARKPAWRLWLGFTSSAIAIIALLIWNMALQRQVAQQAAQLGESRTGWQTLIVLMNDPGLKVYNVGNKQQGAYGTLWAVPSGETACVMVQGLPQLDKKHVYQIWLQNGTTWIDAGTYDSHSGNEWFLLKPGEPIGRYTAILITAEPDGGSHTPQGPVLIQDDLGVSHA